MTSAFSACAQYSSRPISRAPPPERRIPRRVANTAERGGRRPRTRRMYSATRSAYRRKQRSRSLEERVSVQLRPLSSSLPRTVVRVVSPAYSEATESLTRSAVTGPMCTPMRVSTMSTMSASSFPPPRPMPMPAAMPAEETAAMLAVAAPISTMKAVRSSLSDIPCPSAARMGDSTKRAAPSPHACATAA